jgi:hypothetical protein
VVKPIYSRDEFAELLQLEPSTFNKLVYQHKIPGPDIQLSRKTRFWSAGHITRFLENHRVPTKLAEVA